MTLALCGYGTRWNHIIHHHGNTVMVLPGAFDRTLRSGAEVKLLLNHFDHQCMGSTENNLELCSDVHGLAFRYRITDTDDGRYVRSMADTNNCFSIGFDWHGANKETRCINGADVICIREATLFEVSFLHGQGRGAVKAAYGTLKHTDFSKSLREECGNGAYLYEGAAIGFTRSLQGLLRRRDGY